MTGITSFAREHGLRLFLGETGWADNEQCAIEGAAKLAYMRDNSDVWVGWTYWAGGPAWGKYMFSIEPDNLASPVDKPQMTILKGYF